MIRKYIKLNACPRDILMVYEDGMLRGYIRRANPRMHNEWVSRRRITDEWRGFFSNRKQASESLRSANDN